MLFSLQAHCARFLSEFDMPVNETLDLLSLKLNMDFALWFRDSLAPTVASKNKNRCK